MLLTEIEKSKTFLKKEFGSMEKVVPGTYAIPSTTSVADVFMRVVVNDDLSLSDFSLWFDKEFKENYEETLEKYIPRKF